MAQAQEDRAHRRRQIGGDARAARGAARSSATSSCSTSPRRRASPRARRSTSSRPAASTASTRSVTGTVRLRPTSRAPTCCIVTAGVPRKPGMSRDDLLEDQPQDHHATWRDNIKAHAPERVRDRHLEPARRDGLRDVEGHRLPEEPGGRHGRRARHARASSASWPRRPALAVRTCARWCSAATATTWCRCSATAPSSGVPLTKLLAEGQARRDRRAHARGRRRDRRAARDRVGVLRAGRGARSPWPRATCATAARVCPCAACLEGEYGVQGPLHGRAGRHRRRRRREGRRARALTDEEKAMLDDAASSAVRERADRSCPASFDPGAARRSYLHHRPRGPRGAQRRRRHEGPRVPGRRKSCGSTASPCPGRSAARADRRRAAAEKLIAETGSEVVVGQGADPRGRPRQGRRRQGRQGAGRGAAGSRRACSA